MHCIIQNWLVNCLFVVSAVHFAPYLTGLSSMMLIWAAGARCKWRAYLHNRMSWQRLEPRTSSRWASTLPLSYPATLMYAYWRLAKGVPCLCFGNCVTFFGTLHFSPFFFICTCRNCSFNPVRGMAGVENKCGLLTSILFLSRGKQLSSITTYAQKLAQLPFLYNLQFLVYSYKLNIFRSLTSS